VLCCVVVGVRGGWRFRRTYGVMGATGEIFGET